MVKRIIPKYIEGKHFLCKWRDRRRVNLVNDTKRKKGKLSYWRVGIVLFIFVCEFPQFFWGGDQAKGLKWNVKIGAEVLFDNRIQNALDAIKFHFSSLGIVLAANICTAVMPIFGAEIWSHVKNHNIPTKYFTRAILLQITKRKSQPMPFIRSSNGWAKRQTN